MYHCHIREHEQLGMMGRYVAAEPADTRRPLECPKLAFEIAGTSERRTGDQSARVQQLQSLLISSTDRTNMTDKSFAKIFPIRKQSRSQLSSILILAVFSFALAACSSVDIDDRHLQPLTAKLVAQMNEKGMTPSDPILIRIYKRESELEIWKRDRSGQYALLKTYPMCRWSGRLGPKKREGDRQAPEGFYTVTPAQMNPQSQYYLSFNLGYPNELEKALGYQGSALMVHGACTSSGCFALTDNGVGEIYALAREAFSAGQTSFQVQALPFRMTPQNLALFRNDPNFQFWLNLKEGVDQFDVIRQPPTIAACGRRYVFGARTKDPSSAFDPLAPCPAYEVEPSLNSLVAEKRTRDDERVAQIAAASPPVPMSYADGGMHTSFRKMLKDIGPDRFSKMTSRNAEVSRPDAALADPYMPGQADLAEATGSITRH